MKAGITLCKFEIYRHIRKALYVKPKYFKHPSDGCHNKLSLIEAFIKIKIITFTDDHNIRLYISEIEN